MLYTPEIDLDALGLCPKLRAIVDTEVAAGNRIVETWTDWGTGVLLAQPFLQEHPTDDSIQFRVEGDPHYWKDEYACDALKQLVACRF